MDVHSTEGIYALKDLTYTFEPDFVYGSDLSKMSRCTRLYADKSVHRFQLGAGIYKSGSWVSGGCNERRSHARLHPYREALHAEQVAIMSARSNIEGSTLYVSRLAGPVRMLAKPCFWCMHLILKHNIYRVVFTEYGDKVTSFKTATVDIEDIESIDVGMRVAV